MVNVPDVFASRAEYSRIRLSELRRRLAKTLTTGIAAQPLVNSRAASRLEVAAT